VLALATMAWLALPGWAMTHGMPNELATGLTQIQVQTTTTPELRARALVREFPWITRFWAELRGEERARAERAFRRRGQTGGFDTDWDRMGLQDRVLLLFGPGRARAD
jgi:hypothetical protein